MAERVRRMSRLERFNAVQELTAAAKEPMSDLLRIEQKMQEISPRKARQLFTILGRLEHWQNTP